MAIKKAISAAPAVSSKSSSRTSPTPKFPHKSNRRARTKPETATAVPSPEGRLCLSEDMRTRPHYVIRSGKSYLSKVEAGTLAARLSDAVAYTSYGDCCVAADLFNKVGNVKPVVIERLVVELNGYATGSQPEESVDTPMLAIRDLTKWGGTRHNSALAECAEVEERRGEIIRGHMDALLRSQTYSNFVNNYHANLTAPGDLEPDWHLADFATNVFYAGVLGGRKEDGRRDDRGELIFDAPRFDLCHDSELTECSKCIHGTDTIQMLCDQMTMLASSPMFKLLVDDYHADLAKPEALEPDWYLAQFAARLFYAGVIAARKENHQRAVTGHLIMDDPCAYEPKGAVINPV